MNADTLLLIRQEVEKIEKDPGFGKVIISIENFAVKHIYPTPSIIIDAHPEKLDKKREK